MKIMAAIFFVVFAISQWDEAYNNGVVTRGAISLARELAHAFHL